MANGLCKVISMDGGYVLLGRPWLCDNDVFYDNQSNLYRFNYNKKKIKLLPSKPKPKPIESKPATPKFLKPDETSLVSSTKCCSWKGLDEVLYQLKENKHDPAISKGCEHIVNEHTSPGIVNLQLTKTDIEDIPNKPPHSSSFLVLLSLKVIISHPLIWILLKVSMWLRNSLSAH